MRLLDSHQFGSIDSVAASLGPDGIKPTEAQKARRPLSKPTVGLARRRRNLQLQMTIIRGVLTSSDGSTTLGLYEPGVLEFLELVNVPS